MEGVKKDVAHNDRRITDLEHTIYGNGQKGMKVEFIELKTEISTFKKIAIWQIGMSIAILGLLIDYIFTK